MLAFLLAAAFGCNAPNFWAIRSTKCFNQIAFWFSFGVFDMITDLYSISTLLRGTMFLQMQTAAKRNLLIVLGMQLLPVVCAVARLPFVYTTYISDNYTFEAYKLAIPTQLQLHLAVVALSMGKIFRFLNTMNAGYLTSAIDAPSRNATAYLNSKAGHRMDHVPKSSIIESSRHLVPSTYVSLKTVVDHLPMEKNSPWKRQTLQGEENLDRRIHVTREVVVTYETVKPEYREVV